MKLLFRSSNLRDIGMVSSLLEELGIAYLIRNETIPLEGLAFFPELWILNDNDFAKARALREVFCTSPPVPEDPWICPSCGEQLEGQFALCWNCGASRPGAA